MQAYEDAAAAEALPHSAAYAMEPEAMDGQEWAAHAPDASAAEGSHNHDLAEGEEDDVVDVINEALNKLLAKAQEDIEAANAMVAKKREELEAAEADAEEKVERLDELREQAQALSEDEQWQGMYHRLRAWSREQGHCNPRRNWQAKIDAEEKALGNWSGKQRRDERQGKLNPFKKEALERIGFTFDTRQQGWEEFHEKLKAYLAQHGKVPDNLREEGFKGTDVMKKLVYFRAQPKKILGEYLDSNKKDAEGKSIRRVQNNLQFTQDKIDVLTEAGLNWMLTREQVERLRDERGLTFPMPQTDGRPDDGDLVCLEKHAWLTNYEALVEFKRIHGHTYVTPFNSSQELSDWAKEQRKRMLRWEQKRLAGGVSEAPAFDKEAVSMAEYQKLLKSGSGKKKKNRLFNLYQGQMLAGIGFVYHQPDIDWMEQYERLSAFRRLFGTTAIPNKYASFEHLQGWLDENKRLHMNLPPFEPRFTAVDPASGSIKIPLSERQKLLDDLGALDVSFGGEEAEAHKSHYFFRTAEQVRGWESGVLKPLRDTRNKAIDSLTDKAIAAEIITLDSQKEREFFWRRGALVAASVEGRENLPCAVGGNKGGKKFYSDGRPTDHCRISRCFNSHGTHRKRYLCEHHYDMLESFMKSEARRAGFRTMQPPSNADVSNPLENPDEWLCTHCEKEFDSYAKAARHEKNCGTVQVATEIPAPENNCPGWAKPSIPDHLTGEARTLAVHYGSMVCKVTMGYKKASERSTNVTDEHVCAALGQKPPPTSTEEDEGFCLPAVKFPSKGDESESIKLFHRCAGPLAATVSGREQLIRDGETTYGDGRPTCFCRVSGCQMVFAERASMDKRYLCNWHHAMVERDYGDKVGEIEGGKRKQEQAFPKFPKAKERRAYKRAKNETSKVMRTKGTVSLDLEKKPAALTTENPSAEAESKPLEPGWWKKYGLPPPPPPSQSKMKSADSAPNTQKAPQMQSKTDNESPLTSSMATETALGPADADMEKFMDC